MKYVYTFMSHLNERNQSRVALTLFFVHGTETWSLLTDIYLPISFQSPVPGVDVTSIQSAYNFHIAPPTISCTDKPYSCHYVEILIAFVKDLFCSVSACGYVNMSVGTC